ncbi:hypothetical protein GLP22_17485 [Photobacterium carnosum]|uniref:EpsG family protein n=1 Tax=Photobacterium carnosum TaxID=2023717 RepID=UPI001E5EEEA2|nr:hypothetical protein [Photobacterium carnosum]
MIKLNNIISIFVFFINPTLGIIYSAIKSNTKTFFFLVTLYMAFVAYVMIPYSSMDIFRYYNMYERLNVISFGQIGDYFNVNYFIVFFVKIINMLGLNKEFIPFSTVFISYGVLFYSFYYYLERKSYNSINNVIICLCVLSVALFFGSASGLRNGLSVSISILAIVMLSKRKSRLSYFLFFIAAFVHSFTIIIFLLSIISYYIRNKKFYWVVFLISIFYLISGVNDLIIEYINIVFPSEMSTYIIKEFIDSTSVGVNAEMSVINAIIFNGTTFISFLICFYITIICFFKKNDYINRLLVLFLSLCLVFYNYPVFFGRYNNVFIIISALVLIYDFIFYKKKKVFFIFLFFTLLYSIVNFLRFRYIFTDSIFSIFKPMIYLFLETVNLNNLRDL